MLLGEGGAVEVAPDGVIELSPETGWLSGLRFTAALQPAALLDLVRTHPTARA